MCSRTTSLRKECYLYNMKDAVIFIGEFLVAFGAMSVTEFCWTMYIHSVRDEKLIVAGFYNMAIFLFSSFAIMAYMDNKWMLIPGALGAFAGTYVSKFFYTKDGKTSLKNKLISLIEIIKNKL